MSHHPSNTDGCINDLTAPKKNPKEVFSSPSNGSVFQRKPAENKNMASFLRSKIQGDSVQRPSSAPPAEVLPQQEEVGGQNDALDGLRMDPNYAAYYYYYSRFDPRLPPPMYAPGQSWQGGTWGAGANNMINNHNPMPVPIKQTANPTPQRGAIWQRGEEERTNAARRALVDMIQEDFPRTPSPLMNARRTRVEEAEEEDPLVNAMKFVGLNNVPIASPMARAASASPQFDIGAEFFPSRLGGLRRDEILGIQRPKSVATPSFDVAKKFLVEPIAQRKRDPMATPPPPGFGRSVRSSASPMLEALKSPLLEEFRNNKNNSKFELVDIHGYVVEFSGDQHGSRFLQQKLETASVEDRNVVFKEIFPHALQLMTDVFGNYVIQKFFELGSPANKTALAQVMKGHVVSLSTQMYGCRVVQKALEHLHVEQQTLLVKELEGHVLECVKDQNGNHVIQKCIERVPPDMIQSLIRAFSNQVYTLATHPYGCRVIQRLFEHCPEEHVAPLLDEVHRYVLNLAQDQYGNYVVQHVLEKGYGLDRGKIVERLMPQIITFSKHKFASNVVEKCVLFASYEQKKRIIEDLVANAKDINSPLFMLMKDQYANYVIQKMIDKLEIPLRDRLLSAIKPLVPALKKYSYGKHIVNKVEKLDVY